MTEHRWGIIDSPPVKRLNGNGTNVGIYDAAFSDNKTSPVHRWTPWIAGYSFRFVDDVLASHPELGKRAKVLDPFSGVGTTLIQARMHGCDVVGFDINPYAALATRVKLSAFSELDPARLEAAVADYRNHARSSNAPNRSPPPGFKSRIPFFSPVVERKVLQTLDFIDGIDQPVIQDAFRVALGAVLVSVSNYTYEPSLGSRPAAGKPLVKDADVAAVLSSKLLQMAQDTAWLQAQSVPQADAVMHTGDFLEYPKFEAGKAHLAITSPPYLNNYHYVRNTRPQLWWLGLLEHKEAFRDLEHRNIGKFWQTVRDAEQVDLAFQHTPLERTLEQIRATRRDRGPYGGPGWANYVASYFNDCHRFLGVLRRALDRRGEAVIVVGNSIIQGIQVPVEVYLADIAVMDGWDLTRIEVLRKKRVGASILNSSVRRGRKPGNITGLYESAVVLSKRV